MAPYWQMMTGFAFVILCMAAWNMARVGMFFFDGLPRDRGTRILATISFLFLAFTSGWFVWCAVQLSRV